jgi:hypothetical protein
MIRLEREEIYKLVWEQPMTEIAKIYLISDVGFRKACLRLNIPNTKGGALGQDTRRTTVKQTCSFIKMDGAIIY